MRLIRPIGLVRGLVVVSVLGVVGATAPFGSARLRAQRSDSGAAASPSPSSKLSTVLADLIASVQPERQSAAPLRREALAKSVQDALRGRVLRISDANEVQVYVLMSAVDDTTVAQLTAAGAIVEIKDAAHRRVQARIPVARLAAVAQLPVVDAIRPPSYARRRTGQVTSEGDAILHAADVRSQFTVDGTGVRVGVISDGLKGVFATGCVACLGAAGGPISTGDLPNATGTRNASGVLTSSSGGIVGKSFQANGDLEGLPPATPVCGFPGAGGEGTALLEIVHDLAPGAKLSFANADTDLAFTQAVNFLAASNDVVLDDIGFYGEPYDGTSAVSNNTAAALNNPSFPIRAYFTSVGNDADEHYDGVYADSGVEGSTINGVKNAGHLHLFQQTADTTDVLGLGPRPYNVISLPQNGEVLIFLTWDDPFGGSKNNYDLYLVQQSTGRVVASSTDAQSGSQDPSETIDYVNTGAQDLFQIVVQNVQNAAQPKHLNIFSFQPECATAGPQVLAPPRHERHNYNTAVRSIAAQSDAGGSPATVMSVGAICSASAAAAGTFPSNVPDQSCLDTSNSTVEFFSSRGPTIDGRTKPDITAIDGVSITGAGKFSSPFFGTSAAAPHMGGVAALLLESAPCLLNRTTSTVDPASARTTVRSTLLKTAVPLGGAVPNNTFGAGRADALAAVQTSMPGWKGSSPNLTFDGNNPFGATLTADQLGFKDPNQCQLTKLSWSGGCGTSPGSTITCPFGASSVNVMSSNNGVAFGGGADLNITVTNFTVTAAPATATVTAGQTATYNVTVASQGGPYNTPVTLGCANLPPQATCTFNPPAVTPGNGSAQSVLTLTTAATTAAATPDAAGPSIPQLPGNVRAAVVWSIMIAAVVFVARRRGSVGRVTAAAVTAASAAFVLVAADRVTFSASAMASGIAVFPDNLVFDAQTVGTSAPAKLVFVTNVGADTLNISSITPSGDFSATTTCAPQVPSGANCGIAVTFTPTTTGARTGTLAIGDDAPGAPHVITLAGTGQSSTSTGSGTPAGSYVLPISGTAGTLTQTSNVTLVVQ